MELVVAIILMVILFVKMAPEKAAHRERLRRDSEWEKICDEWEERCCVSNAYDIEARLKKDWATSSASAEAVCPVFPERWKYDHYIDPLILPYIKPYIRVLLAEQGKVSSYDGRYGVEIVWHCSNSVQKSVRKSEYLEIYNFMLWWEKTINEKNGTNYHLVFESEARKDKYEPEYYMIDEENDSEEYLNNFLQPGRYIWAPSSVHTYDLPLPARKR